MVTKRAKQLGIDYIFEYSIDGSTNKITIVKGVWCITVRFMEIAHPTILEYIIPTKAKEIKMPIDNIYFPALNNENEIIFKINFSVRSEVANNQTINYYCISQNSVDNIRQDLNVDL